FIVSVILSIFSCFSISVFLFFYFFFFNDTATPEFYTFPYTTLFRSHVESSQFRVLTEVDRHGCASFSGALVLAEEEGHRRDSGRSEEHTSELQSRRDLVCRLLLEKKKKKKEK